MTLRYDDTFSPGIAAGQVQLWMYEDGWQNVSGDSQTDVADRLITATLSPMEYFAVSTLSTDAIYPQPLQPITAPSLGVLTPEPASLGLIAMGAAALLPRRRRSSAAK